MNGAGVARCEGMAVFVKNALPGESVTAKIISVKSHYAYALPLEIGGVSPMRSTPSCPLFGKACTPADPVGPCMVSGEGACAAAYRYGEL